MEPHDGLQRGHLQPAVRVAHRDDQGRRAGALIEQLARRADAAQDLRGRHGGCRAPMGHRVLEHVLDPLRAPVRLAGNRRQRPIQTIFAARTSNSAARARTPAPSSPPNGASAAQRAAILPAASSSVQLRARHPLLAASHRHTSTRPSRPPSIGCRRSKYAFAASVSRRAASAAWAGVRRAAGARRRPPP